MIGGGLRLHLFAALATAVVAAALAAAFVAYHVFDRELDRALEARLQMLVAETGRVLDAGIAAGLDLDRPQLQERALRHLGAHLVTDEVISVIDSDGRTVASSNPAEIGEPVEIAALLEPAAAPPGDRGDARVVVVRPIQSLFGAPAGYVTARIGGGGLDQPRRAFIAKVSLTTAGVALAGLFAAALAAWLPWPARRAAVAIQRHLQAVYAGIGTGQPTPTPPTGLPAGKARALERFTEAVESREHDLRTHAEAVDLLDEAA